LVTAPLQNLSENLNVPAAKEQSETRRALVVEALHPKTKDNKIAAEAYSSVISL
jgi:hypothetical protein